VHPLSGIYAATKALDVTYGTLKRKGTTRDSMDSLTHFAEFNELIGAAGGRERRRRDERWDAGGGVLFRFWEGWEQSGAR